MTNPIVANFAIPRLLFANSISPFPLKLASHTDFIERKTISWATKRYRIEGKGEESGRERKSEIDICKTQKKVVQILSSAHVPKTTMKLNWRENMQRVKWERRRGVTKGDKAFHVLVRVW